MTIADKQNASEAKSLVYRAGELGDMLSIPAPDRNDVKILINGKTGRLSTIPALRVS